MTKPPAPYVLWLPSWYPNKLSPFDGDFIQRHAKAAALYNDIAIIKLVGDANGTITTDIKVEVEKTGRLTEHIIYFKKTTSWPGKLVAANKWIRIYKKAIANHIRQNGKPSLVHVHVAMKAGMLALWIKTKYQVPFIVSEHWTIFQPASSEKFTEKNFFFKYLTRKIIKRSLALLTVSDDLGMKIQKLVFPKPHVMVPNVADENLFYFKPGNLNDFVFLHVSNMNYQKNAAAIIENFAVVHNEFANIKLVLVGPASSSVKQVAERTGLIDRSIFFRGEVTYQKVAEEFHRANALILFSRFENQPCVIIEALCSGVPVISTPVGGIPEIIDDTNGVFANAGVKGSLAEAMRQMMKNYSSFDRKKISESGRSRFSYSVVGKMISDIYHSALQNK